ncbi:SGNH/GDSL hydrolase family protein [Corynebacterium pseudokroppenstedtii]|uniref:SGNH/GDSL hydrolase family protein n=1 Tax=Corynebacterium pseudokroppenstedtii TaxID=2804917 RepID=UPI00307A126A
MKSPKKVVGSLAIAACTAVMGVVGSTPSASALEQGDKYVALGDSYASVGSLTSPQFKNPACVASTDNYAHKLAQQRGLQLDDATCAWAFTYNYDFPQNHALPFTALTGQRERVTEDTKLVTLTLGGNDAGTAFAFPTCFIRAVSGVGESCRVTSQDAVKKSIYSPGIDGRTLLQREIDIINDIKHRAPNAEIVVTGYMNAFKPDTWCLNDGFLSSDERTYFAETVDEVNNLMKDAANQTGVKYVAPPNEEKGWCDGGVGNQPSNSLLGFPDNTIPIHPTAAGQQRMADAISAQI